MTDPVKLRRKVASQISLAPSPSSSAGPSSSSATPLGARVKARVDPSNIVSTPSPSSGSGTQFPRPTPRSTPSTLSLRSAPASRSRSPAPPPSSSTPTASSVRIARTPGTPSLTTRPSFTGNVSSGAASSSGTPIPRIRAAKSVVDSPVTSRTTRTPDVRRAGTPTTSSSAAEERRNRARAQSLRSNTGDGKTIAKVRPSIASSNSVPVQPPVPPVPSGSSPHAVPHIPRYTASTPSIQTPPPQSPLSQSPPRPQTHILSPLAQAPLISPGLGIGMDDGGIHFSRTTWRDRSPDRMSDSGSNIEISSNRSSPTRRSPQRSAVSTAQHALAYILQHPTASAPTSPMQPSTPLPDAFDRTAPRTSGLNAHSRPKLPYNPHMAHPPPLPPPPISPELKTVALPALTPARLSEEWSRAGSSMGQSSSIRKLSGTGSGFSSDLSAEKERDRLSGATAVEVAHEPDREKDGDGEVDVVLGADMEEAKMNRKVADLEISNASLLAINKMLEATKAKQRTEIIKLRRMLRESIAGGSIPSLSHLTAHNTNTILGSPLSLLSPSAESFFDGESSGGAGSEAAYFDEEMIDPQLEARWDKIADLVTSMKRRGEAAVEHGKEEIRAGPGRVLGWMEIEENNKNLDRETANHSRTGEGEDDGAGDETIDSIAPSELEGDGGQDEGYGEGGETSREEVDMVI
ncbi:hypothetical protein I317_06104 [Kwoniella heveanensis CBS 569]|nr:hypothetical protein I317_06104 [Kwoniella heveanensis CBS 569]